MPRQSHTCFYTLFASLALLASLTMLPVSLGQIITPDIGLTGSLYALSPIVVPQGGVIKSDSFFIVVFNHMEEPATVNLTYEAPPGIIIGFEPNETVFTLPPKGHRRIRVVITVSEEVVPGDYDVYIRAQVVKPKQRGVVVVSTGVSQHFIVRVIGDSATLSVKVVDPGGNIIDTALVRIQPVGMSISIYDSRSGVLNAVLAPGRYRVVAYLSGEPVSEALVSLAPGDNKSLVLEARVLYVERLVIQPVLGREGVVAARLRLALVNLYKTLRDITIVLSVARDGVPLENRTLVSSSVLPKGRSDYTFDYVPPGGFEPGNYTFRVLVYGFGGKLVAVSRPRWMYIRSGGAPWPMIAAVLAALLILVTLYYKRRSRGRR